MVKVRLVDYFGFTLGTPDIPKPFPRVLVWGNEFFMLNVKDIEDKVESPRYHLTSGYVLDDTKVHSGLY